MVRLDTHEKVAAPVFILDIGVDTSAAAFDAFGGDSAGGVGVAVTAFAVDRDRVGIVVLLGLQQCAALVSANFTHFLVLKPSDSTYTE